MATAGFLLFLSALKQVYIQACGLRPDASLAVLVKLHLLQLLLRKELSTA